MPSPTEKPTSEVYRPELTQLPPQTRWQMLKRRCLKWVAGCLARILLRVRITGREYFPTQGPVLMVSNHLGDADAVVGLAAAKTPFDVVGKIELYDIPVFGRIIDWYGIIWVHRGRPDRRALRTVLDGLAENRMIAIAPEGRESVTGGLEEGTDGAAYIALKADVPILPVVLTGTENWWVYGNLRRFRRTEITITAGPPFRLSQTGDRRKDIHAGTQTIMKTLAQMLPPAYQGIYREVAKEIHDNA